MRCRRPQPVAGPWWLPVITWLNRGTLHLVRAEDYRWLHPLVASARSTDNGRRLRQEGLSERPSPVGSRW